MNKSFILGLVGLAITSTAFAQKYAVTTAKAEYDKYIMIKGTPKLADPAIKAAKENIDKAVLNEKTSSDPLAWTYKALIYADLAVSAKGTEGPSYATEAASAIKKARELDASGTQKASIDNASKLLLQYQVGKGKKLYDSKDYAGAYTEFNKGLEYAPGDTTAAYAAGLSAMYAKDYANGIARFNELLTTNYSSLPQIYENLAYMHIIQKDTSNAIKILSDGAIKFPNSSNLATREIEYSLMSGKEKAVIEKISAQAAKNPSDKLFPYYLGLAYASTKDYAKAEAAYKKAIAIDPNYKEANINLSGLIVNSGLDLLRTASKIPANKPAEYTAAKKRAMSEIERALPYLLKAVELDPKDEMALSNLKRYYSLTENTKKAAEIEAQIKALK